jgi:methionyl aminopeptidase
MRTAPRINLTKPSATSDEEGPSPMNITIKSPAEQDKMRAAGRLAADLLDMIGEHVVAGATTDDLNRICHDYQVNVQKAVPAPLGYRGFPKSICTSVNHVVCHGIPSSDKRLKQGDIVNVDVTPKLDGWHGDSSRMYSVGPPTPAIKRLIDTTHEAMWIGIRKVRPGLHLGEIGIAIQQYVEAAHYSVVREYCGHGIGQIFHEDPQVLHYDDKRPSPVLKAGMIFTIEPMVNAGKRHIKQLPDGWTVITKDHSLSAQWEHTVLVTDTGFEVLTLGAADRANLSALTHPVSG